jgi:hypothetical protein
MRDQKQSTRPKLKWGVEQTYICRPRANFLASSYFIRLDGYQYINHKPHC